MEKMKPRTLSGFMELLPAPQQQMERMMDILRKTYSLYGFTPLDTPLIEASEVLLAKGGGETEKQIYRFTKGDADLSLRFDLTVPLAKYVALHYNELSFPFRRYQIGKVYRGERAQRGRFREFYQADIDVIGDGKLDITNEAEIPAIIYQTFTELGLKRFQIRVNNRRILNGFYAMQGLTEHSGDIMRAVDKLDKIGLEKVRTLLMDDVGLTDEQAAEILKFIAITGDNAQVIAALEGYAGRNEVFDEGLAQLNRLIPVYLGVLLQDEYRDYVAEIIIEGHTDSTGSYEHNLELSQNRALNVAKYCLNMGTLTQTQKTRLKSIITAQGRSFSDPVYDENGVEDQERSRRVEIKFRLKDAEMIQRMNSILSSME